MLPGTTDYCFKENEGRCFQGRARGPAGRATQWLGGSHRCVPDPTLAARLQKTCVPTCWLICASSSEGAQKVHPRQGLLFTNLSEAQGQAEDRAKYLHYGSCEIPFFLPQRNWLYTVILHWLVATCLKRKSRKCRHLQTSHAQSNALPFSFVSVDLP